MVGGVRGGGVGWGWGFRGSTLIWLEAFLASGFRSRV